MFLVRNGLERRLRGLSKDYLINWTTNMIITHDCLPPELIFQTMVLIFIKKNMLITIAHYQTLIVEIKLGRRQQGLKKTPVPKYNYIFSPPAQLNTLR